jgi:hypothetical protein
MSERINRERRRLVSRLALTVARLGQWAPPPWSSLRAPLFAVMRWV